MKTPNVTPAQIAALVTGLGGQAVAFGLLNGHTEQVSVSVATIALGAAWKIADAIIRHGRSRSLAGVQAASIQAEAGNATSPAAPSPAG